MYRFFLRSINKLRKLVRPTARLDYEKETLCMRINSAFDISRLRACEKEPETVVWLEQSLNSDSILYDIGANVGAYSLIASCITPHVFAFEPSPATFATLCENISLNNKNESIKALQCLLGDANKFETLHFSSIESGAAEHSYEKGSLTQTIPMFKLDTLGELLQLPEPTHVKLDVDGAEMQVLGGMSLQSVKSILIETEGDEVTTYLQQQGFILEEKFSRKKQGAYNFIFSRK